MKAKRAASRPVSFCASETPALAEGPRSVLETFREDHVRDNRLVDQYEDVRYAVGVAGIDVARARFPCHRQARSVHSERVAGRVVAGLTARGPADHLGRAARHEQEYLRIRA